MNTARSIVCLEPYGERPWLCKSLSYDKKSFTTRFIDKACLYGIHLFSLDFFFQYNVRIIEYKR